MSPSKKTSIQLRFSVTARISPAALLIVAIDSSWPASSEASPFGFRPELNAPPLVLFAPLREIAFFRVLAAIALKLPFRKLRLG